MWRYSKKHGESNSASVVDSEQAFKGNHSVPERERMGPVCTSAGSVVAIDDRWKKMLFCSGA